MTSFKTDELNLLLLKYLEESGYLHSAFAFQAEASVKLDHELPRNALISIVQKGLKYLDIEKRIVSSANNSVNPSNNNREKEREKERNATPGVMESAQEDISEPQIEVKRARVEEPAANSEGKKVDSFPNNNLGETKQIKPMESERPDGQLITKTPENGSASSASDSIGHVATPVPAQPPTLNNVIQNSSTSISLKGHKAEVFACEWNPVLPNILASGAGDGMVRLWRNDSPETREFKSMELDNKSPTMATTSNNAAVDVTTLNWTNDGKYLGTGDASGIARIYYSNGSLLKAFHAHGKTIFCARFNQNHGLANARNIFCTASFDKTLIIWDIDKLLNLGSNGNEVNNADLMLKKFEMHGSPVLDISWKNENTFASCSADHTAMIGNVLVNEMVSDQLLRGHESEVNAVRWAPGKQSNMLASVSDDKTSIIWAPTAGSSKYEEKVRLRGHTREIYTVEWSPDASLVATAAFDATVRLWNVIVPSSGDSYSYTTVAILRNHSAPVYALSFSKDSTLLCSGSTDRKVNIYSCKDKLLLHQFDTNGNVFEVHFDHLFERPTRKRVAACSGKPGNEVFIYEFSS